jgi:hypothetical protein
MKGSRWSVKGPKPTTDHRPPTIFSKEYMIMPRHSSVIHSVAIELLRTGTSHNETLSPNKTYLALCGTHPQHEFKVDLEQHRFNEYLEQLRYRDNNQTSMKWAMEALQKTVTKILDEIPALHTEANKDTGWLHLRLVITPKELAMLPFELALTPRGLPGEGERPLLRNKQRLTTLTREIRQVATQRYHWPDNPRVLFAWASPKNDVPHVAHSLELTKALRPWARPVKNSAEPIPDLSPVLTELPMVSLHSLREEYERSVNEKKPYTHVHILAHGTESSQSQLFGLALHKSDSTAEVDIIEGRKLAEALVVEHGGKTWCPTVVTVAACDSGNLGSPILPGASLAHDLHKYGIPFVLASQFPLTKPGSVKLASHFYPRILSGKDPRIVSFYTRQNMDDSGYHDWASLVAYARLPEDLDEQLEGVRLKAVLDSMKTANAWTDHALKHSTSSEQTLNEITKRLNEAINDLEELLGQAKSETGNPALRAEHLGLLGSAYKRKAEHLYRLSDLMPAQSDELLKESRNALQAARDWYRQGHDLRLVSHWNGCQYLSITAALKSTLASEEDRERWIVTRYAASQDLKGKEDKCKEDRVWALGTLAELYILQPLTVGDDQFETCRAESIKKALQYLNELFDIGNDFAKESTAKQLQRYITWWPKAFPTERLERLKEIAAELQNSLPK